MDSDRTTLTVRCLDRSCPERPRRCRGKLLARLEGVPSALRGSGAILEAACPVHKARLVRVRL